MNKGVCVLTFAIGAVIGSVATWKLLKKKYEIIAQEEIDSVKELYSREESEPEEVAKKAIEKPNIMEYASKLKENGYTNYSEPFIEEEDCDDENVPYCPDPYVVSPDDFGEDEEYEIINLTYYSDGVLADENDEEVDNVDETVGLDSLDTFGRFEDDSVHVKNERLKCYYEILRDERNYEDIMAERQHPTDSYE